MSDDLKTTLRNLVISISGDDNAKFFPEKYIAQLAQEFREAYKPIVEKYNHQLVCASCGNRFTAREDWKLHDNEFHPSDLMSGKEWLERFTNEYLGIKIVDQNTKTILEAAKRAAGIEEEQ